MSAPSPPVPSILVIDDEPNNFDVVEALLSGQPYLFHYAASGQEAIASLDAFQPDIILLDVMMPGLDGLEVCRQIKQMPQWQAVPIIMVTALNSKQDLAQCLKTGADDFIGKPINSAELRARVNSMLRIKRQHDSLQANLNIQTHTIQVLENSLQELRGSLSTVLPHELNTPLHGVMTSLDLLITDFHSMTREDIRELLELSYQSACRLDRLIQRFLTYLSLSLGLLQPDPHPSASSELIQQVAERQAQRANRQSDLVCQVDAAMMAIAPRHLAWIIEEILDNAFKFSEHGSPVVLRGTITDNMYQVTVQDKGRGMTAEQIQSMGPFIQFERANYEQGGAGLGAEIAKGTADAYGGRVIFESVYQQKTTVTVFLPLVPRHHEECI